jgi:trehalose 6-phosphate synthase/phosphatase
VRSKRARSCVFIDYDGTLVGFAQRPDLAIPDPDLAMLLAQVAAQPDIELHLVSGRPAEFLERWFGKLPIGLHAEHGLLSRPPGGTWSPMPGADPDWRPRVVALLERVAAHIPGSFVELKAQSLAWHYRQVEPAFASTVAKEVRLHLLELLSNLSVAVVEGSRVLEIRPLAVHKGQVVARALAGREPIGAIVIGDDRTDEDMFCATPADGITVKVGSGHTAARYAVHEPAEVRDLLRALLVVPVPMESTT